MLVNDNKVAMISIKYHNNFFSMNFRLKYFLKCCFHVCFRTVEHYIGSIDNYNFDHIHQLIDLYTDGFFLYGYYKLSDYLMNQGVTVYQYILSYVGSHSFSITEGTGVIGADHGDDCLYLWTFQNTTKDDDGADSDGGAETSGDAEAGDDDADRAFNQAEIDYQLARAPDLIRGVAIFGRIKPAS